MVQELFKNSVSFSVGTGRCGTRFLYELLRREPGVAASHERNRTGEAFHRYCEWFALPVDREGFYWAKRNEILSDLEKNYHSHESSAYLSLSIIDLYERFDAKFIFLIRSPDKVVNSYMRKGWFKEDYVRSDNNLALGYQSFDHMHHFFSRSIVPSGQEFEVWKELGRVGKIAWYWMALNEKIIEQLRKLPDERYLVVRLEDFDYSTYKKVVSFLELKTVLSKEEFDKISTSRPNSLPSVVQVYDWSEKDIREFQNIVRDLAATFGYPVEVSNIQSDSRKVSVFGAGGLVMEKYAEIRAYLGRKIRSVLACRKK